MQNFVLALVLGILSGCTIPQDPMRTKEQVSHHSLWVGLSENPPWVMRNAQGKPTGVEVALVRQFAQELHAEVVWKWDDMETHLEALKHFELHLVIAGLSRNIAWRREVALSQPYYTEQIVVGVPAEVSLPDTVDDRHIAVERGTPVAAYVKDRGGISVRVDDPSQAQGPVAAAAWQLQRWGFSRSELVLHENELVMAVPPGENRWLIELNQFLSRQQSNITQLLEQTGQP